ncbi:hypothetical protein [Metabacillus idriensis]|uniref:hypothetical protein n=1 Tax=Metabacillus idriensis TaxID=324768 RepID=UPI00174E62BE|nr:hypothetical protein [Metabacillus idriensis]
MEDFVLAEGVGEGAGHFEMRKDSFSTGTTDKDPPIKALFAFTGGSVLAEELALKKDI